MSYARTRIRLCADATFRICIHERADVESAQRYWLEVTGASTEQFRRPTLKSHNPKTVRKNTGDDYHGCLRVDVRRSSSLYRRIEAWSAAIMSDELTRTWGRHRTPLLLLLPGKDSNLR